MGVGLVPVEQPYDFSFSITQETNPGWLCYTIYGEEIPAFLPIVMASLQFLQIQSRSGYYKKYE
jgi:hypothetical protein